jgi:hypothetical protein
LAPLDPIHAIGSYGCARLRALLLGDFMMRTPNLRCAALVAMLAATAATFR